MNQSLPPALVLAAVLASACSPDRRVEEIQDTRVVQGRGPQLGASSADRFGTMSRPSPDAAAQKPAGLEYDLPASWTAAPPQQFRDVNLKVPGDVECWVTLMGPGAGGPLGNLTRWRGQLGHPEATPQDLQSLPRVPLLGGQAYKVDITAVDGSRRLVGAMLFAADRSVFVKMQGQPAAVEAQLGALSAFEASLRDPGSKGGGTATGAGAAPAAAGASEAGGFRWTTPKGWQPAGASEFKLYEFRVDGANCWFSLLGGDGGGLAGNLQRWCNQVGHAPLSDAEVQALPKLDVLGVPSPFVRLLGEGNAQGMFGLIVPVDGSTMFVKMIGPSDVLRARQAEFESLCVSLSKAQ